MPTDRNVKKQEIAVYAQTLIDNAGSDDEVFDLSGEIAEVVKAALASSQLRTSLADTSIAADDRVKICDAIFAGTGTSLMAVLEVMTERGDIDLLPRVAEAYDDMAERRLAATFVTVTTAVSLDDKLREKVSNKLASDFGTDIRLREIVDPSIIGGIIMSAHGKRIDASITSQLENARAVLSTTSTGGER